MKSVTWLLCVLFTMPGFAAELTRAPAPDWVAATDWRPPSASTTKGADYEDYLREYQVNTVTHEEYFHYAFRYLTSRGVQNDSTFSIEYAPDYQSAQLHHLTLWRDGKPIDQTGIAFRDVQRESGLEEAMYDGEHTWVGFLKDVRPGDVLEAAYSIRGGNPIFAGKFADTYHVETSYPVDRWSLRVLAPPGRTPQIRALNTEVKPTISVWNGLEETMITSDNVRAVVLDRLAPPDIDNRGRYVLSDWTAWGDVVRWALPLYTPQSSPEVAAKARELIGGLKSPDEKLVALLQFVQDEVRYLGIEVGINSHQPRGAGEVLANGFGDCKDKVMLFCSLAAEAGLEAWPVLVHTRNGALINQEGPTPLAFNHVIAAVASSKGTRYVDATADHQGGPLIGRSLGSFTYGLEIKRGIASLTRLPEGSNGTRELVQTFRFKSFDDEATVLMEYTFSGSDADDKRRQWEGVSMTDWRKDTNEWLRYQYDDAEVAADPVAADDRLNNVFRLSYEFVLKHHWKKNGDRYEAEFYPHLVGSSLYDPERISPRDQPYAIEFPETVKQIRRIEVPEDWNIETEDKTVDAPSFRLTTKAKQVTPRLIELVDEYQSLSNRVEPDRWDEYLKALRSGRDSLNWTLTWQLPAQKASLATDAEPASDNALRVAGGIMGVLLFLIVASLQGADF